MKRVKLTATAGVFVFVLCQTLATTSSPALASSINSYSSPSWLEQSGAVTKVTGPTFTSLGALKKWANDQQINIIVRNTAGQPFEEFHTDGETINIHYGQGSMTLVDQYGHSRNIPFTNGTTKSSSSVASNKPALKSSVALTSSSYTIENGSTYYVLGYDMNNLITNFSFTYNVDGITQSSMQAEFDNLDSVLKNNVEEYTENSNGTYTNDGWSSNPAALIMADSGQYGINPLVILTTLQKEQGLVTKTTATIGTLAWAMGYGATDSGTIYTYSGFANQISGGTQNLYDLYLNAPSSLPQSKSVDQGIVEYYGNYEYGTTVEPVNAATWALYRYTPWTCEAYPYNNIPQNTYPYGGNLAFVEIYPTMLNDF